MYKNKTFRLDEEDFDRLKKFISICEITYTSNKDRIFKYIKLDPENFINYPQNFLVCERFPIGSNIPGNCNYITLGGPKPFEIEFKVIEQNVVRTLSNINHKHITVYLEQRIIRSYYDFLMGTIKEFNYEKR